MKEQQDLKFSVAMITYNQEQFISQAIESVLMQEHDYTYEIVISDDCSTDNTRAIINDYHKRYPDIIRPILHEKNMGFKKNNLDNIRNCRGEYVAMLDGDDYWTDPLKIKKQISFLDAHPEYVFSCHRFQQYFQETDTFEGDFCPYLFEENPDGFAFDKSIFFEMWLTQTMTMVFRRWAIDQSPEMDDYRYFRDTQLFWTIINKGGGYVHGFDGAIYRIHGTGVWSSQSKMDRDIQMYHLLEELYQQYNDSLEIRDQIAFYYSSIFTELALPENFFLDIRQIENPNFTIVCDDNWGKEVYKAYRIPYASPFIGIRIFNEDFAELTSDFKNTMSYDLQFIPITSSKHVDDYRINYGKSYPVALLGDKVELHFVDYETKEEAREKWEERKELINWDNLIFKIDVSREINPEPWLEKFYNCVNNVATNKLCIFNGYHKLKSKYEYTQFLNTRLWVPNEELFFYLTVDLIDYNALLNHDDDVLNSNVLLTHVTQNHFFLEVDEMNYKLFNTSSQESYQFEYDDLFSIKYEKENSENFYLHSAELIHNKYKNIEVDLNDSNDRHVLVLIRGNSDHQISIDFVGHDEDGTVFCLGTNHIVKNIPDEFEWLHFDFSSSENFQTKHSLSKIKGFNFEINPLEKAQGTLEILGIYIGDLETMESIID